MTKDPSRQQNPSTATRARRLWPALLALAFLLPTAGVVALGLWVQAELTELRQQRLDHVSDVLANAEAGETERQDAFRKFVALRDPSRQLATVKDLRLSGDDLSCVTLSNVTFSACRFLNVKFTGATMSPCRLELCELDRCILSKAKLDEATLFRSNLEEIDLQNASLRKTTLEQVKFTKCRMFNADASESDLLLVTFEGCDLSNVRFTGAKLANVKFVGCQLNLTRFDKIRREEIQNIDFTNSNWWRSQGLEERFYEFGKRFAPTENAPEDLRQDWENWLKLRSATAP